MFGIRLEAVRHVNKQPDVIVNNVQRTSTSLLLHLLTKTIKINKTVEVRLLLLGFLVPIFCRIRRYSQNNVQTLAKNYQLLRVSMCLTISITDVYMDLYINKFMISIPSQAFYATDLLNLIKIKGIQVHRFGNDLQEYPNLPLLKLYSNAFFLL